MMGELTAIDDKSIEAFTEPSFLCAVKFEASKKAGYRATLSLAKKAAFYFESPQGEGRSRKLVHVAAFGTDMAQIRAAVVCLDSFRLGGIKYQLFANNRVQRNKYAVVNTLDCATQAAQVRNRKSHCHLIWEDPFEEHDPESDERPETWLVPCKHIGNFDLKRGDHVSPLARFEAAAIERNTHLCPFFSDEGFGPIKPKASKKKYW